MIAVKVARALETVCQLNPFLFINEIEVPNQIDYFSLSFICAFNMNITTLC